MTTTTRHDPQTVIDAAILPPSTVAAMVSGYLELAEENYRLGLHTEALYCKARAEALSYGRSIVLGEGRS